jgi:acetyl-CoA acetyltransferase family protein
MNLREVVIVDGVRTPFVKAGTDLRTVRAQELGRVAMRELIERLDLADGYSDKARVKVDEVCVGNVGNPEDAANIARVVAMLGGLHKSISAFSVHRNCASGLEAIGQGFLKIGSGDKDVMLVGGTESMSNMPLIYNAEMTEFFARLMKAKTPMQKLGVFASFRPGWIFAPIIAIEKGLTDPFCGLNMGQTAEVLAREFGISREEQDAYALESHRKALVAQESGKLAEEIVPIAVGPKYKTVIKEDMGPRKGMAIDQLKKLKPYFDKVNGTVTVGNACPITDGAAMLAMMSAEKARAAGYNVLGRVRAVEFYGLDPERMGLGPVFASAKALDKAGLTLKDMDLIEINEAFSAQVLAVIKAMGSKQFAQEKLGRSEALGEVDLSKVNVNGGAVALGHPVGASGARIVLTALKELKRSNKKYALATLCIGGGQGGAAVVERI